jgi:DnaJ-class molecular chaperone
MICTLCNGTGYVKILQMTEQEAELRSAFKKVLGTAGLPSTTKYLCPDCDGRGKL